MYEVGDWAEVHRLFDRVGLSKSRIAERLGMSRSTVARLLSLDEPPCYRRRPRGSKLDPYEGSIGVMLERDGRVPARVVLERLRREGYGGGITILKDYLAKVRPPGRERRVYQRTSHWVSDKHLQRYVNEVCGRINTRVSGPSIAWATWYGR